MIDVQQLNTIFTDCFMRQDEVDEVAAHHYTAEQIEAMEHPPFVAVQGIVLSVALNPERLEKHRDEVRSMLAELDPTFHESTGGGWSFLNLPVDKHGNQWGEQRDAEQLALLAIGLGLATWLPGPSMKEIWGSLPGGVPYFAVKGDE